MQGQQQKSDTQDAAEEASAQERPLSCAVEQVGGQLRAVGAAGEQAHGITLGPGRALDGRADDEQANDD